MARLSKRGPVRNYPEDEILASIRDALIEESFEEEVIEQSGIWFYNVDYINAFFRLFREIIRNRNWVKGERVQLYIRPSGFSDERWVNNLKTFGKMFTGLLNKCGMNCGDALVLTGNRQVEHVDRAMVRVKSTSDQSDESRLIYILIDNPSSIDVEPALAIRRNIEQIEDDPGIKYEMEKVRKKKVTSAGGGGS